MKKILLLICSIFIGLNSYSQVLQLNWAHDSIGNGAQLLRKDYAGNLYVFYSYVNNAYDFDPSPATYTLDNANGNWALAKYSPSGAFIWAKNFGGGGFNQVIDFKVSNSGNIFITGYFGDTYYTSMNYIDMDPSPTGVHTLINSGAEDIFVAKFDSDCNYIWAFNFGNNLIYTETWDGTTYYYGDGCYPVGLSIDSDENVFIAGNISGSNNDCDPGPGVVNLNSASSNHGANGFYAKYSTNGNYLNSYIFSTTNMTYSSSDGHVNGITIDNNNDLILSLSTYFATVDIDPGSTTNNIGSGLTQSSSALVKYTNNGNFIWGYSTVSTPYTSAFQNLKTNSNNDIFANGCSNINYNLTDTPSITFAGVPIIKYNSNGVYQYGIPIAQNIYVRDYDADSDDIYIVGSFNSKADFNPVSTLDSISAFGYQDGFIAKFSNGNYNYVNNFGLINTSSSSINHILVSPSGIFLQANTDQNVDIAFSQNSIYSFNSSQPAFIALYTECNLPSVPVNTTPIANLSICSGNITTLSASGTGTIGWYSAPIGGTYLGGGVNYTTPALAVDSTFYVQDSTCDASLARTAIHVSVNNSTNSSITQTACSSFTLNSQTFSTTGIYTQTITNAHNCDSIITLDLTILNPVSFTQSPTICAGQSITVGSHNYSASGTYTDVLTAANGCDSTVTTNLNVNAVIDVTTSVNGITITANQTGASYKWLNCSNGYSPVAGATSQSFTPSANGNYAVMITVGNCIDTSACITINNVGINELSSNSQFTIYPNPFTLKTTISFSEEQKNTTIKIIDMLGKEIKTLILNGAKSTIIEKNDMKAGIYTVEVTDEHRNVIYRNIVIN